MFRPSGIYFRVEHLKLSGFRVLGLGFWDEGFERLGSIGCGNPSWVSFLTSPLPLGLCCALIASSAGVPTGSFCCPKP